MAKVIRIYSEVGSWAIYESIASDKWEVRDVIDDYCLKEVVTTLREAFAVLYKLETMKKET